MDADSLTNFGKYNQILGVTFSYATLNPCTRRLNNNYGFMYKPSR